MLLICFETLSNYDNLYFLLFLGSGKKKGNEMESWLPVPDDCSFKSRDDTIYSSGGDPFGDFENLIEEMDNEMKKYEWNQEVLTVLCSSTSWNDAAVFDVRLSLHASNLLTINKRDLI